MRRRRAVTDLCVDYQSGNNHTFPGLVPTPAFTAFDGEPLAGTWTLKIVDNFDDGGIDGIVKSSRIQIQRMSAGRLLPTRTLWKTTWTFADHVANNGCDGDVITRTWTAKRCIKQCSNMRTNHHSRKHYIGRCIVATIIGID